MSSITVIKNVLVFDGERLLAGPQTVTIQDTRIASVHNFNPTINPTDDEEQQQDDNAPTTTTTIDGRGHTLLPGLIDCHVHISDPAQLASCATYGVTTVCDMACMPPSKFPLLRDAGASGPTTWLGTDLPAFHPSSTHARMFRFAGVGDTSAIHDGEQGLAEASAFVRARLAANVDYVKVIADVPGLSQDTLDRIADECRAAGKMTVAHAAHAEAFPRALGAGTGGAGPGFDVLTHVPLDAALDRTVTGDMARKGTVSVPTLTIMETFATSWILWAVKGFPGKEKLNMQNAFDSVRAMREAGVPVLAGTDFNNSGLMGRPAGAVMQRELELLVDGAGFSPVEALAAATGTAAKYFGGAASETRTYEGVERIRDRGIVKVGMRADLILVEGNPTEDIRDVKQVWKVWSNGQEVDMEANRLPPKSMCAVM